MRKLGALPPKVRQTVREEIHAASAAGKGETPIRLGMPGEIPAWVEECQGAHWPADDHGGRKGGIIMCRAKPISHVYYWSSDTGKGMPFYLCTKCAEHLTKHPRMSLDPDYSFPWKPEKEWI
jgi:hypothetical protein